MNSFIKVLLLHELDENIDAIKQSIYDGHPKCLFIVAKSKISFCEKLKWMNPDVVVSDILLDDYTGEEALVLLKKKRPNTPFIFAMEKPLEDDFLVLTVIDMADGNLSLDKLEELPDLIKDLIKANPKQVKIDKIKDTSIYESKKMLNKALNHLEEKNGLAKKEVISDCLKAVHNNILQGLN